MITAQVRGFYTAEMDKIEEYQPKDSDTFCVLVRAMVGPKGTKGEESFDIRVCSPKWLEQYVEREAFLFGTHYLFVARYDVTEITKLITRFIDRCTGDSWEEVARKVSRIGYWEFEDYQTP